jgi:hypothetical protein
VDPTGNGGALPASATSVATSCCARQG